MKKRIIFLFFYLFFMLSFVSSSTPGNISSCQEINESGNYYLSQNIPAYENGCFNVTVDDVYFDGRGYSVNGSYQNVTIINVSNSSILTSGIHGSLFADGYFFLGGSSSGEIIKINPNNISDYSNFSVGGGIGEMTYSSTKDKIYALAGGVGVYEIDPIIFNSTLVIDWFASAPQHGSIASDEEFVYILTAEGDSRIMKFNLTDYSYVSNVTLTGLSTGHAAQYDPVSGFLFVTGLASWVAKVNVTDMNYTNKTISEVGITDDFDMDDNFLYLGDEGGNYVHKINKSDLTNTSIYVGCYSFGIFNSGDLIWTACSNDWAMKAIDPVTLNVYNHGSIASAPNEIVFYNNRAIYTTWFPSFKIGYFDYYKKPLDMNSYFGLFANNLNNLTVFNTSFDKFNFSLVGENNWGIYLENVTSFNLTFVSVTSSYEGLKMINSSNYSIISSNIISNFFMDLIIDNIDYSINQIIDSIIGSYNLSNSFKMIFKNTSSGEVVISNLTGYGLNLTGYSNSDLFIKNDSIYINPLKNWFNPSINITFYGLTSNFINPKIYKNESLCLDCYNFTSLDLENISINISGGGNYSIRSYFEDGITNCSIFDGLNYVALVHDNGSYVFYGNDIEDNIVRGEALINAIENAAAGDSIYLSEGEFDLGENYLDLSYGGTKNISLYGSGKYQTVISGNSSTILYLSSNSVISDLYINTSGSETLGISLLGENLSIFNSTIINVFLESNNSALYFSNHSYLQINISNSTFYSDTKVIFMNTSSNENSTIILNKVNITSRIPDYLDERESFSLYSVGKNEIKIYDSYISAYNSNSNNTAIYNGVNSSMYIYNSSIYSESDLIVFTVGAPESASVGQDFSDGAIGIGDYCFGFVAYSIRDIGGANLYSRMNASAYECFNTDNLYDPLFSWSSVDGADAGYLIYIYQDNYNGISTQNKYYIADSMTNSLIIDSNIFGSLVEGMPDVSFNEGTLDENLTYALDIFNDGGFIGIDNLTIYNNSKFFGDLENISSMEVDSPNFEKSFNISDLFSCLLSNPFNATNEDLEDESDVDSDSSGSGGGGGLQNNYYYLNKTQLEEGYQTKLLKSFGYKFNMFNEIYTLKVSLISQEKIEIEMGPNSLILNLFLNENKMVDINEDGNYDIILTFNGMEGNRALLYIKTVPENEIEFQNESDSIEDNSSIIDTNKKDSSEKDGQSLNNFGIFVGILISLMLFLLAFLAVFLVTLYLRKILK